MREQLFFGEACRSAVLTTDFRLTQNILATPTTPRVFAASKSSTQQFALKMAGGKKKKKPASNPARGFATTSIASKTKPEASSVDAEEATSEELPTIVGNQQGEPVTTQGSETRTGQLAFAEGNLSPEEFEKQLEESELQVLVEKHAQKSKRDAQRQQKRLEIDRRILRGQAENLSTRKWLPPELMEEILDLVQEEGRYPSQTLESTTSKQLSEDEFTVRLWTLHQSLVGTGFIEAKVSQAMQYVLDISAKIGGANKDSIWGLEEALDWLARDCSREELPDYEKWHRKAGLLTKSQPGMYILTSIGNASTFADSYCGRNAFGQPHGLWDEYPAA